MEQDEIKKLKQEYINSLLESYKYSIEKFDHQSLYISGGALALSLTFLNTFIEIKTADCLLLFIVAIILFVLNIGVGFYTHFMSAQKIKERIDKVRHDNFDFKPDKLIPILNLVMMILLLIGLTILVTFCILNLLI
jgi:6-pyruvoyl-tetrahydropterin synthase